MSMQRSSYDSSAGFDDAVGGRPAAPSNLDSGWTDYLISSWDDHDYDDDTDRATSWSSDQRRDPFLHNTQESYTSGSLHEENHDFLHLNMGAMDSRIAKEARASLIADHATDPRARHLAQASLRHYHYPVSRGGAAPLPPLMLNCAARAGGGSTTYTSDASSGSPPNIDVHYQGEYSPARRLQHNINADHSKGCKRAREYALNHYVAPQEAACISTSKMRRLPPSHYIQSASASSL